MAAPTYKILSVPLTAEFTELLEPEDVAEPWLVDEGQPYVALLPAKGMTCQMDPDRRGQKLADFVFNAMQWLIVSERVCEVLKQEPSVESAPLRIRDRKNKPVKASYFFVHPTGPEDCVDLKRSEIVWSAMAPQTAHTITRLVLDAARIPAARGIFRLKEYPQGIIVRSDLVQRLEAAGATGFELLELDSKILL